MSAVVHGWNYPVEKDSQMVNCQIAINKLWIPDVLIDIIKDYLYINADEVRRKYFKRLINDSISRIRVLTPIIYTDIYGRPRTAHWGIEHSHEVELQGVTCLTCGDADKRHVDGRCCVLEWDILDGDEPVDIIPEVTWDVDIPLQEEEEVEDSDQTDLYDHWNITSSAQEMTDEERERYEEDMAQEEYDMGYDSEGWYGRYR